MSGVTKTWILTPREVRGKAIFLGDEWRFMKEESRRVWPSSSRRRGSGKGDRWKVKQSPHPRPLSGHVSQCLGVHWEVFNP